MADLTAKITGSISVSPSASCVPGGTLGGSVLNLALKSTSTGPQGEVGQLAHDIDSAMAFAALPVPASLRIRVLALRVLSGGPFDVRLTQATTGQTTIAQVSGLLVLEFDSAEELTAVELQGSGQIQWLGFGPFA